MYEVIKVSTSEVRNFATQAEVIRWIGYPNGWVKYNLWKHLRRDEAATQGFKSNTWYGYIVTRKELEVIDIKEEEQV